jgi:hypothetical protein
LDPFHGYSSYSKAGDGVFEFDEFEDPFDSREGEVFPQLVKYWKDRDRYDAENDDCECDFDKDEDRYETELRFETEFECESTDGLATDLDAVLGISQPLFADERCR